MVVLIPIVGCLGRVLHLWWRRVIGLIPGSFIVVTVCSPVGCHLQTVVGRARSSEVEMKLAESLRYIHDVDGTFPVIELAANDVDFSGTLAFLCDYNGRCRCRV